MTIDRTPTWLIMIVGACTIIEFHSRGKVIQKNWIREVSNKIVDDQAMAKHCFRNTKLEDLHAATRIDDEEMKALMIDVVDHCYDYLPELCSPHGAEIMEDLKRRDEVPEWKNPELLALRHIRRRR